MVSQAKNNLEPQDDRKVFDLHSPDHTLYRIAFLVLAGKETQFRE